jgi:fatty-acyl-CoA synthase
VLTDRAVAANVSQIGTALAGIAGERALVVMPLYHAGAAITTFAWIAAGVEIRVMADFDPHACVRALDEEELSWATFVPAMIQSMLTLVPDVRERRYPRLRGIAYGASPIAEATLRGALEAFRCGFYQAYGMTETTAVLTMLYPADHDRALAGRPDLLLSCGRPVVGTEVRVVDGSDKDAPARSVGEIVGRGPQLMRGYWAMPDATAESLRGGWMHTGDAGYLDEEGFVYVCDRVKDMIVSGGENVYPREIEDVLFGMDGIADVAVIGVPDEKWGEVGKAFVVTRPGAVLREQEVITWCRDRLAGYKTPRSVEFVEALPRNPSGKVLKTELRAQYWKDRGRNVS